MITVIVPTMWKGKEINSMLPQLNDHPLIGEIILVDNDSANKVETICKLSKVVYYDPGKNIYLTPAWNYGWENSKYDKLLLINDDVSFDITVIDAIYDQIREDVGTITMNPDEVHNPLDSDMIIRNKAKIENIRFDSCPRLRNKAAIIIGIHKKVYEKIPEELLIHFTDYFLFKLCETRGKPNKTVFGIECRTNMSTTVKHFRDITKHEQRIYQGVFEKYGIRDKTC